MLTTRTVRTLDLSPTPPLPAAWAHLSAASGLVKVGPWLYVVGDDELSLGRFDGHGHAPGSLVTLFDGTLPTTPAARKAAKPDLEALALLPEGPEHPFGALIAFGSGSRPNRQRAALLALTAQGEVDGRPHTVDLAPLYRPLRANFDDLNIEGAFVVGPALCLLQRGNAHAGVNACIRFELDAFAAWLHGQAPAPSAESITHFELGSIGGVPLGFTDGTPLPDGGWLFSAAAEDTRDPYLDGRCTGSIVGVIDATGTVRRTERLVGRHKVEGTSASADGSTLKLLMVTDADDRQSPARLLAATLEPTIR